MMKQFKKILCCLILLITMFATCNKVFAFTKGEYFHKEVGTATEFNNIVLYKNGQKVDQSKKYTNKLWEHNATSKNDNQNYPFYCIDPSRPGYSGSNANYWNYKVSELLDVNSRRYLAMVYIIQSNASYHAKSLAIRSLSTATKYYAGPVTDKEVELQKAYYNAVSWWLLNEDVPIGVVNRTLGFVGENRLEDCYKNVRDGKYAKDSSGFNACINNDNNRLRVKLDPKGNYGSSYEHYTLNDGSLVGVKENGELLNPGLVEDGTVKEALNIFIEAIKYADSYLSQKQGSYVRKLTLTDNTATPIHSDNCEKDKVTVKVTDKKFSIKAQNFLATKAIYPEDALTLAFNISGDDKFSINKSTINIQFKTDGINWTKYESTALGDAGDTKFLDYIVSDNQVFEFKISFVGTLTGNGTAKYTIDPVAYTRYYNNDQTFEGAYLIATVGSAESDFQRFLVGKGHRASMGQPAVLDVEGVVNGSIKTICTTCTDVETKNNKDNKTYKNVDECKQDIKNSGMTDPENAFCVKRNNKIKLACSTMCEDHVGEEYTVEIGDLVKDCQRNLSCKGLIAKLHLKDEREAQKINRSIDGKTITCTKYVCKDYEGKQIESSIVSEYILSDDYSSKRELKNILGLTDILQAEIMSKNGDKYACGCTTTVLKSKDACQSYLKSKEGQPTYEKAYCDKNVLRCSKPEINKCVDKDLGTEGKCQSYLNEVKSYSDKEKEEKGYINPTCIGSKFYCDNSKLKTTCEKDWKGTTPDSTSRKYITILTDITKSVNAKKEAAKKLADYLKLVNTNESYKFTIKDGLISCDGTGLNICPDFSGTVYETEAKCEAIKNVVTDPENVRCVKKSEKEYELLCKGSDELKCESFIGSNNKCSDSKEALKKFHGADGIEYTKATCLDEETLICTATCDSLLHTTITSNGEKVEIQKAKEYKGAAGLNKFNSILSLYDGIENRKPGETSKSGLNKENIDDEHVVCNVCKNYEGQAITTDKTLEYYKYQVSNPEEVYNEGGVVACHKDFCKSKPDTSNTESYKRWLKECCNSSTEHFSVEDACKADRNAKSEIDENKTWCEIFDQYCVCNPRTDLTSVCTEFDATDEEVELSTKTRNGHINELQNDANISMCIIDDEAHHLTKDKNNDPQTYNPDKNTGNPYCQVYCKEDYDFNIPTGRYTINGQYFAMGMQITSTRSCYTNKVDYDKFMDDMNNPAVDKAKAVKYINQCAGGWDTDHKSDATITFNYNENNNELSEYIKMIPSGELKFVKSSEVNTSVTKSICNNNYISNDYSACGTGKFNEDITMLDVNGYKYPERFTYAKQIISKTTNYVPESIFYTEASTGVVKVSADGKVTSKYTVLEARLAKDRNLEIPEVGAVPVTLKTDAGVYNYKFTINKLGEYFNGNKTTGRLLDSSDKNKLIFNKNIYTDINGENGFTGKYVCAYVVSCPECQVTCTPNPELGLFCDIVGIESCPDGADCPLICKDGNCAYDSKHGIQYTVHQVSLIDFTNENRTIGANWSGVKGEAAAAEITAKSDTALETPEYTFEFTPAVITEIRNLNKKADSYAEDVEDDDIKTYCKSYSKVLKDQGYSDEEITKMVGEYDYQVCQSGLLTYLNSNKSKFKIETSLAGRKATKGFLSSDYCKNNACAIVGAVGPAWK